MASYPLTWLAQVLRDAGCTVVEEGDWKHRGRDGSFAPKAIMLHHDASPAGETSNGVDVIINGRPGLEGPLSQLWLSYDGVWHVVAAGRANHGGEGGPWGVVSEDDANADCIGIETDHTSNEDWTNSQRSEGVKGVAALCRKLGIDTEAEINKAVLAHKEYAPSRKIDPDPLDMPTARRNLWNFLQNGGEGEPVDTIQKSTQTTRTLVNEEWRDLKFTDDEDDPTGVYAMARGPAHWYNLTAQVYAEGPVGTIFYLRPYKEGGDDEPSYYHQRSFEIGPNGKAFVEVSQGGNLADDKYLRVQGKSSGPNITLTSTRGQVALW